MAGRRRSSSRGRGIKRRKTWDRWIAASDGIESTGAAGASLVDVGWIDEPHGRLMADPAGILREVDETLLRTIVSFDGLLLRSGTGPADPHTVNLGMLGAGLLVWEGVDGVTVPNFLDVPWPISGAGPGDEADWLWTYKVAFTTVPTIVHNGLEGDIWTSSRAKRKLSSGAGILLITEVISQTESTDFCWQATGRNLFALP